MHVKVFPIAEEKKANEFIDAHAVLANGVQLHQNQIIVLYSEDKPGINKQTAVNIVSDALAEVQKELIVATLEKRFWMNEVALKRGAKETQQAKEDQLERANTRVEHALTHLKNYRDLIAEIEKGEFTF